MISLSCSKVLQYWFDERRYWSRNIKIACKEKNSMKTSWIDAFLAEMPKALVIAVGATVLLCLIFFILHFCCKMIFNILKRKADDEADGLQNNYGRLMELEKKLSYSERAILVQTKTKLVTQVCEAWISGVKKSKGEVQELQNNYKSMVEKNKKRSQHGSSESRTSLSKSMAEKCYELEYQLEEWSNLTILVDILPDLVIKMHGPMPEDKPFLLPIVEDILCHLRDEKIKRIGLWGVPKTGKTTIMKSLNNNEDAAKMFDIIIWVSASKDLDFGKLQRIIADRLKLNVEGITDSNEIYHKICIELKGKRYLLLLDEASGSFDPSWIRCYENEDSKVVLTAISRLVCLHMDTDVEIPVEPMSKAVAWEIFREKVRRNVNLPLFRPIAERVANACQGSPQVIDKVASKFRKRDSVHMWEEGLRILQGWPGTDIDYIDKLL